MYVSWLDRAWDETKARLRYLEPNRFLALACAAAFALGTIARTLEIPNREFWAKGSAPAWILVGTGLVAGVSAVINALRLSRRTKRSVLQEACVQLAAFIDEQCPGIDLRDIGVHIWRVGGPPLARRLHRGPEFLLRPRQESHVVFTKGKGVIGRVWETGIEELRDLESELGVASDEAQFKALEPHLRLGLSWAEYRRTQRYHAVWAAPLMTSDRVIGVLSVDIQTPGAFRELQAVVTQSPRALELNTILGTCEDELAQ